MKPLELKDIEIKYEVVKHEYIISLITIVGNTSSNSFQLSKKEIRELLQGFDKKALISDTINLVTGNTIYINFRDGHYNLILYYDDISNYDQETISIDEISAKKIINYLRDSIKYYDYYLRGKLLEIFSNYSPSYVGFKLATKEIIELFNLDDIVFIENEEMITDNEGNYNFIKK